MEVKGVVKRIELAGAFVDIGAERDAMLHISQIQPGDVKNVGDVLSEGQEVTVWVRTVDQSSGRIAVTMFKPIGVEWKDLREGQVYTGHVVRLEKFGAFVDIGAERPGLVHVSEMADGYVSSPGDIVKVGEEIEARVIGVNKKKGKIDLSLKSVVALEEDVDEEDDTGEQLTAMALAMKRAIDGTPSEEQKAQDKKAAALERRRAQQDELLKRTLETQIKQ
jgi:ribosomal protein S1